jgi:chromosome partitioning protein
MRAVAVVNQKGGAGKTTLALDIAVAAEQAGYSTVLIDMDPQGTAEAWSEWRKGSAARSHPREDGYPRPHA